METRLVFSTFADVESARGVVRTLVEERLAACGNILPGLESIYRWNDSIETGGEVLVIFKTASYPALEARLRELHPYELPEIIALAPSAGLPGYLRWVAENSSAAE